MPHQKGGVGPKGSIGAGFLAGLCTRHARRTTVRGPKFDVFGTSIAPVACLRNRQTLLAWRFQVPSATGE
jgi:hypothetical protein